ncbi:hypothetical protein IV203_032030 [Nitzschia inconspicua]|uniref:Uncharacterized protein n=1 Tax=Nitzschia inconspicua TaxID=303405 RepID=A0A9K3LVY7_9STRA|nr:hypothetical protein IV203_032030 [Nitzschia inconspicua]
MSEGRPDRPLRIALRIEPARVLNFLTKHGETESPISLARVGTSSDFGHFLTPALRNRRCRHIISTSTYQSFLTRHHVIHQPFFGDGDSRDSDGEDFEEEAALLNESGGVSQPKDGTSRLCVQGLGQSSSIKFQAAYGDDVAFGIEPVVPLYKINNLAIGLVILGDPFAAVDQKSVFLEKVQKVTNRKGKSLEERCWLVFVGEALARGGEAIQKCLPDNIKSRITSRSLRDAGITELAAHVSLSIYESCARSGHSTGTTQDHYISDQHYLYGLKAGMARAGYDVSSGDYTKKIHLPRVQAIGSGVDNQLHAFLDKCFTVDVPHFDKGGKLRPVLLTCLATLLQHYKAVLIDCGHDNAIIQHLNKAALHSCLNDPRWPRLAPIEILQKWCGLINSDL